MKRHGSLGLLGTVALTLVAPIAPAQELEEIVVTARKREESLQDIPLAISAFSARDIEQLGIIDPSDLARFTPGFSFDNGFGRTFDRPAIRGVTTILNGIAGANAAASFIDGVYVGGVISATDFDNIERVEVIKGPQSSLYGRATYGGAINYITKRPTDEYEGQVKLSVAEHDTTNISVSHSGPLLEDRLYYFVSYGHSEYGGEYRNVRTGQLEGDQESDSANLKLLWTPTDSVDVALRLGYQEIDDGHFVLGLQRRDQNNLAFRGAPGSGVSPRAREYFQGEVQEFDEVNLFTDEVFGGLGGAGTRRTRVSGSLKVDWELESGYTLQSITGYIEDDEENAQDVSYGGYDPFAPFAFFLPALASSFNRFTKEDRLDISQEFAIASPADRPFRWNAGVYYYEGEAEDTANLKVWAPGNFLGIPVGTTDSNGNLGLDEIENTAVFGGVQWDVNDRWTLTAEARFARDEITVSNFAQFTGTLLTPGPFNDTFNSFTPRVTATYRLNDNANLYANIAQGTKPGTFNNNVPTVTGLPGDPPDESLRVVDEEQITQIEGGYKFSNGRTSFNFAAYFSRITDAQFTQTFETPTGGSASLLQNVGETDVLGFEVDVRSAVTDNWLLAATFAYTDSEITEYINVDQADLLGSNGTAAERNALGSVAGNQTPRIPRRQASLISRYTAPVTNSLDWFFNLDVTHESSKFAQVHNLAETGDRTYAGLRVGFEGESWDVALWGRNIFDDRTPIDVLRYIDRSQGTLTPCSVVDPTAVCAGVSTSPRGFAVTLPRGRQFGVSANFRF